MRIKNLTIIMSMTLLFGCSSIPYLSDDTATAPENNTMTKAAPRAPVRVKSHWEGSWRVISLNGVNVWKTGAVWRISKSKMNLTYGSSCSTAGSLENNEGRLTRTISSSSCNSEAVGSTDSVEFIVSRSNKLGIIFGKTGAVWICKKI